MRKYRKKSKKETPKIKEENGSVDFVDGKAKKPKMGKASKTSKADEENVAMDRPTMQGKVDKYLREVLGMRDFTAEKRTWVGEVVHIFSHIRQTLCIEHMVVSGEVKFGDAVIIGKHEPTTTSEKMAEMEIGGNRESCEQEEEKTSKKRKKGSRVKTSRVE